MSTGIRSHITASPSYGASCFRRFILVLWRALSAVAVTIVLLGIVVAIFAVKSDWVLSIPLFMIAGVVGLLAWGIRYIFAVK